MSCPECGCSELICAACGAEADEESFDFYMGPATPPAPGSMEETLQNIYLKAIKKEIRDSTTLLDLFK